MTANTAILKTLEQTLQQFHPALLQKLNAGISDDEVERLTSKYEVTPVDELYDLFMWRNGAKRDNGSSIDSLLIFPNGAPFSLSDAGDTYDLLSITKHLFEPNYFPLFSGDDDNLLLIDLDSSSPTFKTISLYSPTLLGNSTPMTIYDSIPSMIETAVMGYHQNAFWVNDDVLQVNSDTHYRIASSINPNSQYWQFM